MLCIAHSSEGVEQVVNLSADDCVALAVCRVSVEELCVSVLSTLLSACYTPRQCGADCMTDNSAQSARYRKHKIEKWTPPAINEKLCENNPLYKLTKGHELTKGSTAV